MNNPTVILFLRVALAVACLCCWMLAGYKIQVLKQSDGIWLMIFAVVGLVFAILAPDNW